jgi:hypothetical protein
LSSFQALKGLGDDLLADDIQFANLNSSENLVTVQNIYSAIRELKQNVTPSIQQDYREISQLFSSIDMMEAFVIPRVNEDMDTIEALIEELAARAETTHASPYNKASAWIKDKLSVSSSKKPKNPHINHRSTADTIEGVELSDSMQLLSLISPLRTIATASTNVNTVAAVENDMTDHKSGEKGGEEVEDAGPM